LGRVSLLIVTGKYIPSSTSVILIKEQLKPIIVVEKKKFLSMTK
jgi:hypothetical protein